MAPLELTAVVITLTGIALTALRRVTGWPVSLAAALLYLVVFAQARLWADAALQVAFCLFLLKGWADWHRDRGGETVVSVRPVAVDVLVRNLAVAVPAALALGFALSRWTNDPAPFTDGALSVFSLVGQFWTARRYMACWLLWIAVDLAYVVLFIVRDMKPSAALYAALALMAAFGWSNWRRSIGRPVRKSGA